jgi:hypothetical protein
MASKIILLTATSDQGDILKDYIEWHLHLGIDLVLAEDCNSSDETHEILDSFEKGGRVRWFRAPDKKEQGYQPAAKLIDMAREEYSADWIILNDVDEFLCAEGGDLRAILDSVADDGVTAINVSCRNMTGPPLTKDRATKSQTLRIDRPVQETYEQQLSGDIPVPWIFIRHPPKIIVRGDALERFGRGTHEVHTTRGKTLENSTLVQFLHFPIRGYDKFEKKIRNVAAFFEVNKHLEGWWGWHWRRWIRIHQEGRLRDEYEKQFVAPGRAAELVQEGTCSVDTTLADWIRSNEASEVFRSERENLTRNA